MAKPENPPAFPLHPETANPGTSLHGMTLRDWFAGQVLGWGDSNILSPAEAAESAYEYADAMLSARQTTDREDGK